MVLELLQRRAFNIFFSSLSFALFFICLLPQFFSLFWGLLFFNLILILVSLSISSKRGNMYHNQLHPFPCLHCQPHTYIRMVQNLIERCLLHHMDRDQCVKALAEHARIQPLVTITVWKELLKENKDFFQSYFRSLSPRPYTNRYVRGAPRFARRNQWR